MNEGLVANFYCGWLKSDYPATQRKRLNISPHSAWARYMATFTHNFASVRS